LIWVAQLNPSAVNHGILRLGFDCGKKSTLGYCQQGGLAGEHLTSNRASSGIEVAAE
jgi:hypothetical protein